MIWTPRLWVLAVFLSVWSGVGAVSVNIRQKLHQELKGHAVTLRCHFQSKMAAPAIAVVSWSAVGTKPGDREELIVTHYHPMTVTDIQAQYEGRVALLVDVARGTASLRLSSVTPADDKIYECRVLIPNDEEGKQADATRLVVLEPPSNPICGIQGSVRPGHNINLTCHSEEGSPPPSYAWEKWESRMGSQRQFMDRTATTNGGLLSLYDISPQTSGLYTCTSSNKIRAAVCKVNLTVSEDFSQPYFYGAVTGVVTGVVAGVLTSIASAVELIRSDVNGDGGQTATESP